MARIIKCKPNDICFYCGLSATGMDHVIPFCVNGHNTDLVPSCKECNVLLSSACLGSAQGYAKVLAMRDRTQAELADYDGFVRCSIENDMMLKREVMNRIQFATLGTEHYRSEGIPEPVLEAVEDEVELEEIPFIVPAQCKRKLTYKR